MKGFYGDLGENGSTFRINRRLLLTSSIATCVMIGCLGPEAEKVGCCVSGIQTSLFSVNWEKYQRNLDYTPRKINALTHQSTFDGDGHLSCSLERCVERGWNEVIFGAGIKVTQINQFPFSVLFQKSSWAKYETYYIGHAI